MQKILKLPMFAALALLIYMPFHVFLVQWLSAYTGGIDVWKAGKDIVLVLFLIITLALVIYKKRFKDTYFWILVGGAFAYFLVHLLVWFGNPGIDNQAALLGTAYNCRLFGYAILGWGAFIIYPGKFNLKLAFKFMLAASAAVAFLGVLQYLLPKDFLSHFGYSIERGVKPMFFIDDKPDLPRIMSTIRDPNSLGAYLILPITLLSIVLIKLKANRMLTGGLILLLGLALTLTFSRSAWLGTAASLLLAFAWIYQAQVKVFARKYSLYIAAGAILVVLGAFAMRDQYFVQNVIFHADESTQLTSPNDLRVDFAQKVSDQIMEKPFGHGPGTAGLVSIQTDNVVLTENYFLQIAYEVGVQGLILMLALMAFIIRLLAIRGDTYAKVLIAAFLGISISAILLHTWSNEAIAATWFILTGLTIARTSKKTG